MSKQNFQLTPFSKTPETSALKIEGEILLLASIVTIKFQATGDLNQIVIPPLSDSPKRRENLWRETCFEVFASRRNSDRYIEWNFSLSKDWNAFCFETYRRPDEICP